MDVLTQFGTGDQAYVFDVGNQVSYDDNFRDAVPRVVRMPGVSGGYDQLGLAEAPSEIGNVRVTIWLEANAPADMWQLRKWVGWLKSFGTAVLVKQPVGGGETVYCLAKINNIGYSQHVNRLTHEGLNVTIDFQVTDPFWRAAGTTGGLWDDGTIWDDGTVWDGEDVSQAVSGFVTEFTITPDGNAATLPLISFICGVGETATQLKIQRLVGGAVIDEVSYSGTLVAGNELVIDAQNKTVKLDGADAYGNAFDFRSTAWFSLTPNVANAIRVKMAFAADAGTAAINYEEMYI